ncbi:MAG: DUF4166 domain-containing protein [Pseudomonadota bacterium]
MSELNLRVLVVGGYGTFGARIAKLLKKESRLTILVAGRSLSRAQALCEQLDGEAELIPVRFDRDSKLVDQLRSLQPHFVIDASGPFQHYGHDPYRLVKAAIACNIHYADLADASDFVNGIQAFNKEATQAGIFVLSGLSSFPVLTCAVTRRLSVGLQTVRSVVAGIAPSPHAVVGRNVINAIASYAGKPIEVTRQSRQETTFGLTESRYHTIKVDGLAPLPPTRFSLVDVPDHVVIKKLWPSIESVWIGAGPRPEFLHFCLNVLAKLVSLKVFTELNRIAPLMDKSVNFFRFGQHRGGMFVSVEGTDNEAQTIKKTWNLIAEGDDGPMIPSMAAKALILKILNGRKPEIGARAALSEIELSDYESLFSQHKIASSVHCENTLESESYLYQKVLRTAYRDLHKNIQTMHKFKARKTVRGKATVVRGNSWLSKLIAHLIGFPAATDNIDVEVTFTRDKEQELWQRKFGTYRFESVQEFGKGRFDGLLVERFGFLTFGLALLVHDGNLYLQPQRWTCFGIPMPCGLLPRGNTYETTDDLGRFQFHVEIVAPLAGLIVKYIGWLEAED